MCSQFVFVLMTRLGKIIQHNNAHRSSVDVDSLLTPLFVSSHTIIIMVYVLVQINDALNPPREDRDNSTNYFHPIFLSKFKNAIQQFHFSITLINIASYDKALAGLKKKE